MGEGEPEPLEEVGPLPGLLQAVLRPPADRRPSEGEERPQELGEGERPGVPILDHEEVAGERALKRRQPKQSGQDAVPIRPPLELDHHPQPLPVRLVPEIGDPLDRPVFGLLRDRLQKRGLPDLVGNLGDHDPVVLHKRPAAEGELSFPRLVGRADPVPAHYDPPVGKSGPGRRGRSSSTVASG